ncbi:AAA family ATPase [Mesorhizobium xinjiangense]|uniref:AAA family ATPase n=1 Tax=Mesorhizobium xinjiangense TaxID=2678685 RepID=UPI0018DB7EE5|nr:AAA family ATPase [Mesorhizobium xinjiangense]
MQLEHKKRLIGRDAEIARVCQFLTDRAGNETRVVLVSGKAGVGKSTLAGEVLDGLEGGYWLVSTKFDQYLDLGPARFFTDALSALAERILALPGDQRSALRNRLVDAVSPNGQLVINLCPRMGEVLGAQPELIELAPQENQVRLSIVLRKLVAALATPEHRLIFHLDDLQWADAATLRLLCDLVVDPDVQNVAVLVAFRSDDKVADRQQRVSTFLRSVQVAGVKALELTVGGLSEAEIQAFIHQSVELPPEIIGQLSRQIKQSTGGVPLAAVNFVDVLVQRQMLQRDPKSSAWSQLFDEAQELLSDTGVHNLVDLRLSALEPQMLRTLTIAAAMGQTFDIALLAEVGSVPVDDIRSQVEALKMRHLVVGSTSQGKITDPDRQELRFAHDTVQQAAHDRASAADMGSFRLRGARIFARRFDEEADNVWLFRAVSLFNHAPDAIPDRAERQRVFDLNTLAARRALDAGGPSMALAFARAAMVVLQDDAWSLGYENTRMVHLAGAEAAYLCGERQALEDFCRDAAENARDVADWARARAILLQERVSAMAYPEALDMALDTLRRLKAPLPRHAVKANVATSFARTMLVLRRYTSEELFQLPRMRDERSEREMEILMLAASAAYFAAPNLFALIVLRMVRLSVQKGNCIASAFGWECYGLAMCAMLGRVEAGYGYGILALRLIEKFKADHLRARVHMLFNVFVRHWQEGRDLIAEHLLEGEKAGIATGDLEFATYCMWHRCNDAFWSGTPLADVRAMARQAHSISTRHNQSKVAFLLAMMLEFIEWAAADPGEAPLPDDDKHEAYCLDHGDFTSLCYVKLYQALRHAIAGDMMACLAATREIDRHSDALQGQFYVPHAILLRTLAASECARAGTTPKMLARLAGKGARRLRHWADKGAVDVVPLAGLAECLARWAAGDRLKALEGLGHTLQPGDTQRGHGSTLPVLYAGFAADSLSRLEAELGLSRGASDHSEAVDRARAWGSPVFASRLAGNRSWQLPLRSEGSATPVRSGPLPADPAAETGGLDALTANTSQRILDMLGGTYLELVLLEDGEAFTLLRATRGKSGAVSVDHTGVATRSDAATAARKSAETTELSIVQHASQTAVQQMSVSLPQYDGTVACLLVQSDRDGGHAVPAGQLRTIAAPLVAALRHERLKRSLDREQSRRVSLTTAHGRFVPQFILRALGHSEITELRIGDFAPKRMTVMFCDMRGSTGIVEAIGPQASMELFNELFAAMESEVLRAGGYVDNFIGDAVLSLFETPADVVVQAAIALSRELRRLHGTLEKRGLPVPGFGIGMSTGDVVLGAVGGLNQIRGGSIGDTVNLAARVEGLTRRYRASTLIAESTFGELTDPGQFALRQVDYITVVGKQMPIRLFEVIDALPADRAEPLRRMLARYEEGVAQYYARDFANAAEAFSDCVGSVPHDIPAKAYLERARTNMRDGVADDWTGVHQLREK